jgi:transposase-like protein
MTAEVKNYSKEQREQVVKEVKDTGNMALVARNHGIKYQTVVSWMGSERRAPAKKKKQEIKVLEGRLKNAELENRILKELLKKTNQLWLTDGLSAPSL